MRSRDLGELTDREREVLELLRRDFTNEQIAQRLSISLDGAKYHVSQILSKLGVATCEEAAALALGERRRWWAAWPLWAKIAGAASVSAAALAAIVVALPSGGKTLESNVSANNALTWGATPSAIGRASSTANVRGSPGRASLQSPTPAPSLVVVGPTTVDVSKLPTPGAPKSTPTDTPDATVTATATPRPCETDCSGIKGIVVLEGVCPVEPYPPYDCHPPYQATIAIWNADRTARVLEFTTNEQGQFHVPLAPGDYYVEPQGDGNFPAPPGPFPITVPRDRFLYQKIITITASDSPVRYSFSPTT